MGVIPTVPILPRASCPRDEVAHPPWGGVRRWTLWFSLQRQGAHHRDPSRDHLPTAYRRAGPCSQVRERGRDLSDLRHLPDPLLPVEERGRSLRPRCPGAQRDAGHPRCPRPPPLTWSSPYSPWRWSSPPSAVGNTPTGSETRDSPSPNRPSRSFWSPTVWDGVPSVWPEPPPSPRPPPASSPTQPGTIISSGSTWPPVVRASSSAWTASISGS